MIPVLTEAELISQLIRLASQALGKQLQLNPLQQAAEPDLSTWEPPEIEPPEIEVETPDLTAEINDPEQSGPELPEYEPPVPEIDPMQEEQEIDESRDPELRSREEEKQREEYFQEEARRKEEARKEFFQEKEEERQDFYREQDLEKQNDFQEEARLEKERQEQEAFNQQQEELEADRAREEQEEAERDHQRDEVIDSAKEMAWESEKEVREAEFAELEKYHRECQKALDAYGLKEGLDTGMWDKQLDEKFAYMKSQVEAKQEARWAQTERLIEDQAYHGVNIDSNMLQFEAKERLEKQGLMEVEQEKKRLSDLRQADWVEKVMERDLPKQQQETILDRQADFKQAEADSWKAEQDLRERENKQLQQMQADAKNAIEVRFAHDPDRAKELLKQQETVFKQQEQVQVEWQQKRWAEEQQNLVLQKQRDLEQQLETQRQDAIRRSLTQQW